jgi:hypothetical protein
MVRRTETLHMEMLLPRRVNALTSIKQASMCNVSVVQFWTDHDDGQKSSQRVVEAR